MTLPGGITSAVPAPKRNPRDTQPGVVPGDHLAAQGPDRYRQVPHPRRARGTAAVGPPPGGHHLPARRAGRIRAPAAGDPEHTLPPRRPETFRFLENNLMEVEFSGKVFIKQGTIYSYGGNLTFWVKDRRPGGQAALVIITGTGKVILHDKDRADHLHAGGERDPVRRAVAPAGVRGDA